MYQVTIVQRDGQWFEVLGQDGSVIFSFKTTTLAEAMEELVARRRGKEIPERYPLGRPDPAVERAFDDRCC